MDHPLQGYADTGQADRHPPTGPGRTQFWNSLFKGSRARPNRFGVERFLRSPALGRSQAANYLISTLAPASSHFFLIVAASSLFTPSFTVLGAPSTRSFASFNPRLVTSRTALITLILFAPTSVRTTTNSVFSSAGAAAPPAAAPPAITTGAAAAAETPKASSIFFTNSEASSRVRPLISSRIVSTLLAIAVFIPPQD